VTARPDDDALSWDGDDDPTLDVGANARPAAAAEREDAAAAEREDAAAAEREDAAAEPVTLADGYTAVGRGSERVESASEAHAREAAEAEAEAAPAAMGNAALIGLGVLGGVYLLYVIGWVVGGLRLQAKAGFLVEVNGNASPLWTAGNWAALVLAALAPVLWFVLAYGLTRHGRPWLRWLLLALGVILLVPWPFVMMGAIGA
jgi:hypothetical protein